MRPERRPAFPRSPLERVALPAAAATGFACGIFMPCVFCADSRSTPILRSLAGLPVSCFRVATIQIPSRFVFSGLQTPISKAPAATTFGALSTGGASDRVLAYPASIGCGHSGATATSRSSGLLPDTRVARLTVPSASGADAVFSIGELTPRPSCAPPTPAGFAGETGGQTDSGEENPQVET
jgi:hypothetical protein